MSKQLLRIVAFCSLVCSSTLLAQQQPSARELTPARIIGLVTGPTGPLIAADVSVLEARDSIVVATSATAADGRFMIELPYGRYFVRISYLGYKPKTIEPVVVSASAPVAELGVLRLERAMIARTEPHRSR